MTMHHSGGFTPRECETVPSRHCDKSRSPDIRGNTRYQAGAGPSLENSPPNTQILRSNIAVFAILCEPNQAGERPLS